MNFWGAPGLPEAQEKFIATIDLCVGCALLMHKYVFLLSLVSRTYVANYRHAVRIQWFIVLVHFSLLITFYNLQLLPCASTFFAIAITCLSAYCYVKSL